MVDFKRPAASRSLTPRVRVQDALCTVPSSFLRQGGEWEKETRCGEQVRRGRETDAGVWQAFWLVFRLQLGSAQHQQHRVEATRPSWLRCSQAERLRRGGAALNKSKNIHYRTALTGSWASPLSATLYFYYLLLIWSLKLLCRFSLIIHYRNNRYIMM